MTRLAVIADIHLHDLHGGYGYTPQDGSGIALRTLADTRASTRVFNESEAAITAILDDIVDRGIRHVALLGDQTDDGQSGSYAALDKLLARYEADHGLFFYATLGNHDAFGPDARHQAKWLTGASGTNPVLVSSDPDSPTGTYVSEGMRGLATPDAISAMSRWGFMRPAHALHWETPFGQETALSQRLSPTCPGGQIDASYLIEPIEGIWLLMLDANTFSPTDTGWLLHADAAWDHVLTRRTYLLPWIEDVVRRAAGAAKTLIACSHYPMVSLAAQKGTPAETSLWMTRMPSAETSAILAQTGLRLHLSGHMHVASTTQHATLTNIAAPSPVADPGGYLIMETQGNAVSVFPVSPAQSPGFNIAFEAYETQARGNEPKPASLNATSYREFLKLIR